MDAFGWNISYASSICSCIINRLELDYYKGTHLYQQILEIGKDVIDNKVPYWKGHELPLRFVKGTNVLYHGSKLWRIFL
jgi:hypothetical protein